MVQVSLFSFELRMLRKRKNIFWTNSSVKNFRHIMITTFACVKNFISLEYIGIKVVKNCKILTFKVNYLCQNALNLRLCFRWITSFLKGDIWFLLTFFDNFNFYNTLLSEIKSNLWQLLCKCSTRNFITVILVLSIMGGKMTSYWCFSQS